METIAPKQCLWHITIAQNNVLVLFQYAFLLLVCGYRILSDERTIPFRENTMHSIKNTHVISYSIMPDH